MKEPAGEANMTVIVVVLIGVVVAAGLVLVPKQMHRIKYRSCCHSLGGRMRECRSSGNGGRLCCSFPGQSDISSNGMESAFESCYGREDLMN